MRHAYVRNARDRSTNTRSRWPGLLQSTQTRRTRPDSEDRVRGDGLGGRTGTATLGILSRRCYTTYVYTFTPAVVCARTGRSAGNAPSERRQLRCRNRRPVVSAVDALREILTPVPPFRGPALGFDARSTLPPPGAHTESSHRRETPTSRFSRNALPQSFPNRPTLDRSRRSVRRRMPLQS